MTTSIAQCSPVSAASAAKRVFKIIGAIAVALGFALAAGSALAGPTIINGGFETGDFTGWTPTGNQDFNGVQCPGPGSPAVFQGNCSAFFGPFGTLGGISQTLDSLIVGNAYTISFAFEPDGGTPSSFAASFGGSLLLSSTNTPAAPYNLFSFVRTATATTQVLAFNFRNDSGFSNLDAVSVAPRVVPEPGSMALLGIGIAGLWVGRRKGR
jgi:hypothetical protein